jgi:demethylmenaquinone methyltransferase/2-methoxy-6-polyprenyl-1,4-benzoquinol methylase
LFDETASDYDRINAVFSFGTGRRYRRQSLLRAGLRPGDWVLDVATGTGLVAVEARQLVGSTGLVAALDVSWGMLQQARAAPGLRLVQGSADALPFAAESFDVLTMGYALRHVAALGSACAEFYRVLRPGGQAVLLEVGRPDGRLARHAARLYLGHLVPLFSRLVGSTRQAGLLMHYYWETIESCVQPETILAALRDAGFADAACGTEFGVLRTYTARRPP